MLDMGAFRTSFKLFRLARQGRGLRNFCLAYLCVGLGVMGSHSRWVRKLFINAIALFSRSKHICLYLKVYGKPITITMRRGNESDYLVAGELVAGGYSFPTDKHIVPTAIFDGGANIGIFALQACARFPGLPLKCYEPDAANIEQLKLNLANNGIHGDIVPKALWSETAELFYHPRMSYTGFVSREKSEWPISCELPQLPDGTWLKLDIEGAEHEVLPALLRSGAKPAIITMEIHDFLERGEALMNVLRQYGYTIEGPNSPEAEAHCVSICAYKL